MSYPNALIDRLRELLAVQQAYGGQYSQETVALVIDALTAREATNHELIERIKTELSAERREEILSKGWDPAIRYLKKKFSAGEEISDYARGLVENWMMDGKDELLADCRKALSRPSPGGTSGAVKELLVDLNERYERYVEQSALAPSVTPPADGVSEPVAWTVDALDHDAMEAALLAFDGISDSIPPAKARRRRHVGAAIVGYLNALAPPQPPRVTDEMVERAARGMATRILGRGDAAPVIKQTVDQRWREWEKDARVAIESALAQPGSGDGEWQPIETAPKQRGFGSYLVHCPARRNSYLVSWNDIGDDEPCWHIFGGGPLLEEPAFWRPRPAAPLNKHKQGDGK